MTNIDFEKIVNNRLAYLPKILIKKGDEYGSNADRLHNFKEAAHLLRTSQADACLGFMTKHLISLVDLVKSNTIPPPELIQEKVGDTMAYCLLLEGIWEEERAKLTTIKKVN